MVKHLMVVLLKALILCWGLVSSYLALKISLLAQKLAMTSMLQCHSLMTMVVKRLRVKKPYLHVKFMK